jgi:hypothetical protein
MAEQYEDPCAGCHYALEAVCLLEGPESCKKKAQKEEPKPKVEIDDTRSIDYI